MHTDARNLDNNSVIEGDICIIGAGAAGISMAMEWNNSKHKVILLEGGGFEYDEQVQDFALLSMTLILRNAIGYPIAGGRFPEKIWIPIM